MYLSRLILNPRNQAVRRDLSKPYQLHKTIMTCFPTGKMGLERTAEEAAGVLFRVEEDRHSGRPLLLVQSTHRPDWSKLVTGSYLLPPDPFDPVSENPAVKEHNPVLSTGQMLHFRLQANPTKRLGKSSGKDAGKRVGLYESEKQIGWLRCKGKYGGFQVISATLSQEQLRQDKIERKTADNQQVESYDLRFFVVRFDGLLQVTDPQKFGTTLAAGIGSGKAFGCGLLSIAPAR